VGHSKIYPNWHFWFENIPSGNPDFGGKVDVQLKKEL
jgi:hypothetical protein